MYVYAQSELYREMDLSLMLRLDMMRIVSIGTHALLKALWQHAVAAARFSKASGLLMDKA